MVVYHKNKATIWKVAFFYRRKKVILFTLKHHYLIIKSPRKIFSVFKSLYLFCLSDFRFRKIQLIIYFLKKEKLWSIRGMQEALTFFETLLQSDTRLKDSQRVETAKEQFPATNILEWPAVALPRGYYRASQPILLVFLPLVELPKLAEPLCLLSSLKVNCWL